MNSTTLLSEPAKHIVEKAFPDIKLDFSRALRASITFDTGNSPPKLQNAQDIFNNFGVSVADQVECKISLTRREAQSFLRAYGKVFKGNQLTRLFLNIKNYKEVFGREVPRLGKKDLVFTYAEVQYLVQYGTQLQLPDEISSILV